MSDSNDESTTCSEPIKKKKKKQKHDDSKKSIAKELQCHNSEHTMKKKHKKRANATEDASEVTKVVPKKNTNELLDEDMASCDPTTKADVLQKKTTLAKVVSSSVPISAEETHKKRKRKKVVESLTCDPRVYDGVPEKKKKKNVAEDAAPCELRSIAPVHKKKEKNNHLDDNKKCVTEKTKHKKSKPAENRSEDDETPETANVTEVIQKKKEVYELVEQSGSHTGDQPEMSTQAKVKKKKKKKKRTSMDTKIVVVEDDVHHGEEGGDSLSSSKKKKVFEREEELGSFIDELPEQTKVKKKKKATSMKTDYVVIEDHDVHHGKEDSLRVSKKKVVSELEEDLGCLLEDQSKMSDQAIVRKKKRKATPMKANYVIEVHDVHYGEDDGDCLTVSKKNKKNKETDIDAEGVHRESNLSGNSAKDSDITSERALKKKKKASKAKQKTELMDCTDECSQVTCHEKKTSKKKKQEMIKHTDQEHSTTEVLRKKKKRRRKKKKNKGTENSKETSQKQEDNIDVQMVSAQEGNTDEEHVHTVKQDSLQENVEQESGNAKGARFGQWDTATFQNSQQQTKFFRLLGGFKKGNQATLTSTSNKVKANMALEKKEEQVLERSLLAEFDKAVSWKQNRGIGLGFQPAQTKTFYIDKNVSRSVKFED